MTRRLGAVLILLAAFPLAVFAAPTALASHFDNMFPTANTGWSCFDNGPNPSGGVFCQTDNSDFTAFREASLSSTGKNTISSVLWTEFAPTDLTVTIQASGVYSGGSETDVIFQYRNDLPPTAAGVAWCDDAVSSTKCDQHYAAFNTPSPLYALVCHETGHTVGLTHGPQAYPWQADSTFDLGCMGTATGVLGSHNASQINSTY